MEAATLVAWVIGLAVAVVLTLPLLKLIALVLRTLSELSELSALIAEAAHGLAEHADAVPALSRLPGEAHALREGAHEVALGAELVERQLARAGGRESASR